MFHPQVSVDNVVHSNPKVKNLVDKGNLKEAAQVLAYSVDSYDNIYVAGQLLLRHIREIGPKNIREYLSKMGSRLNTETRNFMSRHASKLDSVMDESKILCSYMDWMSAYSLYSTYLSSPDYGLPVYETPEIMWMRIAIQCYYDEGIDQVLYCYRGLSMGYVMTASPTVFNAGMKRQQMGSCFLFSVEDNTESIIEMSRFIAFVSKHNGGAGLDVSRLRHSKIGKVGISNGLLNWLKMYDGVVRAFDQTGKRKGACTLSCRIHHIDIDAFIKCRDNYGEPDERIYVAGTSLWTPWLFWKRVREDGEWSMFCPALTPKLNDTWGMEFSRLYEEYEKSDVPRRTIKARKLFQLISNTKLSSGYPYIMNGDGCMMKSNQKHLGMVRGPNLCVAGETPILTDKGYIPIEKLQDKVVNVWNGNRFSQVTVRKTSDCAKLVRVEFSNGRSLLCTPDHKFIKSTGDKSIADSDREAASSLQPGTKLVGHTLPILEGDVEHNIPQPYLFGQSMMLTKNPKVPINATIGCKLAWFAGVVDILGVVADGELSIRLSDKNFLLDIQLMLQTMGIFSNVDCAGMEIFDEIWALSINRYNMNNLLDCGFSTDKVIDREKVASDTHEVRVVSVQPTTRSESTYCFTEQYNHAGVFNGVLTGQCQEIVEYAPDGQIASCNLHSITLSRFVVKKYEEGLSLAECYDFDTLGAAAAMAVNNINKIIDHNWYPLGDKIKKPNLDYRPLGIGVSGLSDALYMLDIHFEHPIMPMFNKMVFACIYFSCVVKSLDLAILHGPCDGHEGSPMSKGKFQFDLWADEYKLLKENGYIDDRVRKEEDDLPLDPSTWKQKPVVLSNGSVVEPTWESLREMVVAYGLRNTLLTTIMPTGTSAQLMGTCEQVEAHQGNIYSRKLNAGAYPVINKHMFSDLSEISAWNGYTSDFIQNNGGSMAGLDEFINSNPDLYPDYNKSSGARLSYLMTKYKTMYELSQKRLLQYAAARSRYTSQAHSNNMYFNDPSPVVLQAAIMLSASLGLKTVIYYLRRRAATNQPKLTVRKEVLNHANNKPTDVCNLDGDCISCQ